MKLIHNSGMMPIRHDPGPDPQHFRIDVFSSCENCIIYLLSEPCPVEKKGFSKGQILDELDKLADLPDEDDDDLADIEIEPEDLDDDGITETEEVVYENQVP
jgi:hypothetical protein